MPPPILLELYADGLFYQEQAECYYTLECPISLQENLILWLATPGCFIPTNEQPTQSCCPIEPEQGYDTLYNWQDIEVY